jgi:hypothetical protein
MAVGKKPVLGGKDAVKVAIVQKAPRFLDKEASLTRAETYIAEAASGGAELIVFPEVWLAGYPYWTEGWDSALQPWVGGRVAFRDVARPRRRPRARGGALPILLDGTTFGESPDQGVGYSI